MDLLQQDHFLQIMSENDLREKMQPLYRINFDVESRELTWSNKCAND